MHEDPVQKILSAATFPSSGKKSVQSYLDGNNVGCLVQISNDNVHKHHPRITQTYIEVIISVADRLFISNYRI